MFDKEYIDGFIDSVEQKCKLRQEKKRRMTKRIVTACVALAITAIVVVIGFRPEEAPIGTVSESSEYAEESEPPAVTESNTENEETAYRNIIYGEHFISDFRITSETVGRLASQYVMPSGIVKLGFEQTESDDDAYCVVIQIPERFNPTWEYDGWYERRLEAIGEYCIKHSDLFPAEAITELQKNGISKEWVEEYGNECWKKTAGIICNHELNPYDFWEPCFEEYFQTNGKQINEAYPTFDSKDSYANNTILHYMAHCENAVTDFASLGVEVTHRGYGFYTAILTNEDIELLKTGYYSLIIKLISREYTDDEWALWKEQMDSIITSANQAAKITGA